MRWVTWVMCCLIFGIGSVPAFAQPDEEAQKTLQGTWTATKEGRDGKPADEVLGNRLSFSGNRFQIRSKNGNPLREPSSWNRARSPRPLTSSIRKGP